MSFKKGLLFGTILGGTAAYVAYKALDEEEQRQLKDNVIETAEDLKDRAVDYLLYANDAAEDLRDTASDKLADTDFQETLNNVNDLAKQAGNKVVKKLSDIQDSLNDLKSDNDGKIIAKTPLNNVAKPKESDDIVIDGDDAFADGDKAATGHSSKHEK